MPSLFVRSAVLLACLFSLLGAGHANAKPVLQWSEKQITQTIGSGKFVNSQTVTFTATEDAHNVEVFVTPSIDGFIDVGPTHFDHVVAGETYAVTVDVKVAPYSEEGSYDGTIHLKAKNATLAKPLSTTVTVDYGDTVINPNTRTLSEGTLKVLAELRDDGRTLVFNGIPGEVAGLPINAVLVLPPSEAAPHGFIGRITNIAVSDGQLVVNTELASIDEAFDAYSFKFSSAGLPRTPQTIAAPGVSILVTEEAPLFSASLSANLDNLNDENNLQFLTVSGEVGLGFDIDVQGELFSGSKTGMATFTGYQEAKVNVEIGATFPISNFEQTIFKKQFGVYTIWLGWAPVVFVSQGEFLWVADGEITAGYRAGFEERAEFRMGMKWENLEPDGFIDADTSLTKTGTPGLGIGANFSTGPAVRPRLLIYGISGPAVKLATVVEVDYDSARLPATQVFAVAKATGEFDLATFVEGAAEWELPLALEARLLLFESDIFDNGTVNGSVIDALTGLPVSGAAVQISRDGGFERTAFTDAVGNFTFDAMAGADYDLVVKKNGYLDASYFDITVEEGETRQLEVVFQVDESAAVACQVDGRVIEALRGLTIPGATVNLRYGINNISGSPDLSVSGNAFGNFSFGSVEPSNFTLEVSAPGFITGRSSGFCANGVTVNLPGIVLVPVLPDDQWTIVLTWGSQPSDLDGSLEGPTPTGEISDIYFMWYPYQGTNSLWPTVVRQDLDDVTSYGPETITLLRQAPGDHIYRVANFTDRDIGGNRLSYSGATVRAYKGSTLRFDAMVPRGYDGIVWEAFKLNGDEITPINKFGPYSWVLDANSRASASTSAVAPAALVSEETSAGAFVKGDIQK